VIEISQQFIVPDDVEVLEAIGEWPEVDDEGTRVITCRGENGESLVVSYSPIEGSVRVRWRKNDGDELLDLFHEGATRLMVSSGRQGNHVVAEYHAGDFAGNLDIQTSPHFAVRDRLFLA
jgi:hypothetical protein